MNVPKFTVFTATYNRRNLLVHVYDSLCMQTHKDFEWLIVDDGSTDETDDLVAQLSTEKKLEIVYLRQENRGKHVAFNRGVEVARGELFLPLDSDDTCVPTTLECLLRRWDEIPLDLRSAFSGVTCLCADEDGRLIGSRFPQDVVDAWPLEFCSKFRITGEKWGFQRTDILRKFPFPENPGERFVPEGLIWNRIARHYKMRYVNEVLRIYKALPDGLSSSSVRLRADSPISTCAYYWEKSELKLPPGVRARALINYNRFYLHAMSRQKGAGVERQRSFPVMATLPFGYVAYALDLFRR